MTWHSVLSCCSCDVAVYGGLKRLQQWNEASVHVMCATDVDDVSSTFTTWADSLCATVTSIDSTVERLPLWQGCVLIYGSEVVAVYSL